ncbi:hypothetical protein BU26DRAFT_541941 [Trematosphaeria pertusa]|uniref:Tachykinin family protein n=1 Tax=Trematosphaeria pertusa TaxID=390896 RepID=A0A6A6I6A9_9PLEO|nr:uncharacterized protein BU26DRAFT_541941 [Trematosphaeria pertusa]KAF2245891.1 hypothetical protein BU26DRAFT_541941 [Trematosphaeria pertusa]
MDRSAKPAFNFVNLSHPDELKDEETQLRIRRLAMAEVGKARRKPKTRRERNEIVLEFRTPAGSPSSIERLGGGEVDPFSAYPIDLDETGRGLVAYIFRNNSSHSRQLRGSWWPVGLADPAAFYMVLGNSRLYMLKELNGAFVTQDDAVSLLHQNNAIRSMGEKMKDPRHHTSDELLGAVGAFMCHHYILGGFAGWENHRNAMMRITQLRGGIDKITKQELRITMSWCDLVGAFSQDIPSIVTLPRQWEADSKSPPHSPRPYSAISLKWKQQLPTLLDWISIFDDVNQLISLERAFTDKELRLAATTGSWMEPTMVRLLAIRPLVRGSSQENVIEEVCRLGTMLFLAPVWRWIGARPVWTFNISRNLLSILHSHMVEWGDLKPLLAWVIYFAAVETRDAMERSRFVFFLAVVMGGLQIREWEELMQIVKRVLWVEKVFANSEESIREEVMRILRRATPVGKIAEEVESEGA